MKDTDEFIEQLIMNAIPDVDEQELETMIEETKPVLYDRVITHIIDQVPEKERQWILDILETQWVTQEVADKLKSQIPNFPKFLEKVYADFETMYLKEFKSFEKEFGDEEFDDEDKKNKTVQSLKKSEKIRN